MSEQEQELKTCPFCGWYEIDIDTNDCDAHNPNGSRLYASCCWCFATVGVDGDANESIYSVWNHRPIEDAQAARIAALEAEVAEQRQRAEQAERERDALVEKWPMFVQGGDLVPNEVIDYEDGGWWYGEGKGRRGPFPVREEAVRAAAS